MDNQKALKVLKLFYLGCENMAQLSLKAGVTRDEAREILKGARECGLISYSSHDTREVFVNIRKKKLGEFLRAKGALK